MALPLYFDALILQGRRGGLFPPVSQSRKDSLRAAKSHERGKKASDLMEGQPYQVQTFLKRQDTNNKNFPSIERQSWKSIRSLTYTHYDQIRKSVDMNCTIHLNMLTNPKGCVQILGQKRDSAIKIWGKLLGTVISQFVQIACNVIFTDKIQKHSILVWGRAPAADHILLLLH